MVPGRARVQQSGSNKCHEVLELFRREPGRVPQQWIEPCEHGLEGTQPVSEILVDAGGYGIVAACRLEWMQMVIDRIFQSREASIVEEGRLQAHVSKRRAAKLVTIGRISRGLLEPEI